MKRYVKADTTQDLVDLLAKTADGKWVTVFENIPVSQADAIWRAGFATGENRFSIDDDTSKRFREMHNRTLKGESL